MFMTKKTTEKPETPSPPSSDPPSDPPDDYFYDSLLSVLRPSGGYSRFQSSNIQKRNKPRVALNHFRRKSSGSLPMSRYFSYKLSSKPSKRQANSLKPSRHHSNKLSYHRHKISTRQKS